MTTDGLIGQEIYSRAEVCVKRLHACHNRLVWTLWALQNAAEISQRDNPASNKKAARCTHECKPRRLVVVSPNRTLFLLRFFRGQWSLCSCRHATASCCAVRSRNSRGRERQPAAVGIGSRSFGEAFAGRGRSDQRAFSVLNELQYVGTSVPID